MLGLRENISQFPLLVLVNAFVGATVGLERSILVLQKTSRTAAAGEPQCVTSLKTAQGSVTNDCESVVTCRLSTLATFWE